MGSTSIKRICIIGKPARKKRGQILLWTRALQIGKIWPLMAIFIMSPKCEKSLLTTGTQRSQRIRILKILEDINQANPGNNKFGENKMKLWFMKKTITLITVLLTVTSSSTFASGDDANDPNNYNFIWVVALEKEPNDIYWNPTLYKINIEEAKVVERKKIAEQGAPIFCYSLPGDRIKAILNEGIAANGTYVDKRMTIELTIDKEAMQVVSEEKTRGIKDEYRPLPLRQKISEIYAKRRLNGFPHAALPVAVSQDDKVIWVIKGRPTREEVLLGLPKKNLTFCTLDSATFEQLQAIPVNPDGQLRLKSSSPGPINTVVLKAGKFVVLLWPGQSYLGHYAPSYVMIVDTELKIVKYVAIGSDPARGIAY